MASFIPLSRPGLVPHDGLINHHLLRCGTEKDKRVLIGYGSGLYPIQTIMGIRNRGDTHAARAAAILHAQQPSKPTAFDFISCVNDEKKKSFPCGTNVEYKGTDDVQSPHSQSHPLSLKVGQTSLRSLCDDLRLWNGRSGMHWRLSKPHLMIVASDAKKEAEEDIEHWLNKVLRDVDYNRYCTLATTLLSSNHGNNFSRGFSPSNLQKNMPLGRLLNALACTSYDGDIRTLDALSIESVASAKWMRHLDQHSLIWAASFLPILFGHADSLGVKLSEITMEDVDEMVKAARALEERRTEEIGKRLLSGSSSPIPTDSDLLSGDFKASTELAKAAMKDVFVERDMNFWMIDERQGLEQPTGELYEILPVGLKGYANRISARRRLWGLYSPMSMQANEFKSLGGPLPTDPPVLRTALRAKNRLDSLRLGTDSLAKAGAIPSVKYILGKSARSRMIG